jgi:hypothetical protein
MTTRPQEPRIGGDLRSLRWRRPLATLEELVDAEHGRSEPAGALVVRAWFEDGRLRARVTSTTDLSAPDETVELAGDREAVLAAVRRWLDALERARG